MGKKISPHAFRLGITRTWDSVWYKKRSYKQNFLEDLKIRAYLEGELKGAQISRITILRKSDKVIVQVTSAKPGVIVGRGGENIQKLQGALKKQFGHNFEINVQEIRKPDADAQLVANNMAEQVEKRFPYRRVAKIALEKAKESNAQGIKIMVAGRLNGVDIARKEIFSQGKIPLHTLRADIDYATAEANTMYGVIGIKVWIYKGLVFKNKALN